MKFINFKLLCTTIVCFAFITSHAQQRFQVHVDYVKPAKYEDYLSIAKDFKKACDEHQPETSWIAVSTSDDRFMYVSPMDNWKDV